MFSLKKKHIHLKSAERLYQMDKPIIGLTGGIATGKSTVTKLFEDMGITVICADQLVKRAYQDEKVIEKIQKRIPSVFGTQGLDFKLLREAVFNNKDLKKFIEQTIYNELPSLFKEESLKQEQDFIIYDVPLLFEKELFRLVDLSVCVYANRETQLQRVMKRDGNSEELALKIIDSQMDIEEKKNKANFVIENNTDLVQLKENFDKVTAQLFK